MSDFTYTVDKAITENITYNTLVSNYETGVEQRRLRSASARRQWTLVFSNRTGTELSDVRSFFNTKYGSLTSFTWTNPVDSTEYTVRFLDNSFSYTKKGYDLYDFQVRIIEVK